MDDLFNRRGIQRSKRRIPRLTNRSIKARKCNRHLKARSLAADCLACYIVFCFECAWWYSMIPYYHCGSRFLLPPRPPPPPPPRHSCLGRASLTVRFRHFTENAFRPDRSQRPYGKSQAYIIHYIRGTGPRNSKKSQFIRPICLIPNCFYTERHK